MSYSDLKKRHMRHLGRAMLDALDADIWDPDSERKHAEWKATQPVIGKDFSGGDPLGRWCKEHEIPWVNHGHYSTCPTCFKRDHDASKARWTK